jgi:hypothetical protein
MAATQGEVATPGGTRMEVIRDPTLNNMAAFEVPVPTDWNFQGILIQGSQCVPTPFVVFRATSPDGLTFVKQMPTLGWAWGTGFAANVNHRDCLPLKEAMGAQDFLKYLSAILKVEYVADDPVPAEIQAKLQKDMDDAQAVYAPSYAAMHVQPPRTTRQVARAIVQYRNGTFVMKGRLGTIVDCTETQHAGMKSSVRWVPDQPGWTSCQCTASVRYISAPESDYPATVQLWDASEMAGRVLPQWAQAWIARNQRQSNAFMQQMNAQAAAQRQASAQQFAHDQAVRQQMHEQFLATMQHGTDLSMQRAAEIANSNHTRASDWVDYALNQRTVLDPNSGQVSKVSNAYTYTWIDSTGQVSYQTSDPNANPNGTLQGIWIRQQVVHGDGSQ